MTEFKRTQRDYPSILLKIAVVEQVERRDDLINKTSSDMYIQGAHRTSCSGQVQIWSALPGDPTSRPGEEETACGSDNYPADTRAKNRT